jgi:hypothetical protein
VEEIYDFSGEALEFVVEVVRQQIYPLVSTFDPAANLGEMLGLLVTELIELGAQLAQKFLEFLFQRGSTLEVVDHLEKDEENRRQRGRIDEPRGEMRGVRRRNFLRVDRNQKEGRGFAKRGHHGIEL